jgi:hypothetical protein
MSAMACTRPHECLHAMGRSGQSFSRWDETVVGFKPDVGHPAGHDMIRSGHS